MENAVENLDIELRRLWLFAEFFDLLAHQQPQDIAPKSG
jgi:hypothetical protein